MTLTTEKLEWVAGEVDDGLFTFSALVVLCSGIACLSNALRQIAWETSVRSLAAGKEVHTADLLATIVRITLRLEAALLTTAEFTNVTTISAILSLAGVVFVLCT